MLLFSIFLLNFFEIYILLRGINEHVHSEILVGMFFKGIFHFFWK